MSQEPGTDGEDHSERGLYRDQPPQQSAFSSSSGDLLATVRSPMRIPFDLPSLSDFATFTSLFLLIG